MKTLSTRVVPGALAFLFFVPHVFSQSTKSNDSKVPASRFERLVGELERELVPYARDPSLDSLSVENPGGGDFDLVLLADDNPAISDECYKIVLRHAAESMMRSHPGLSAREAMNQGIVHVREMRRAAASEGRTYGAFFRHVVDCEEWCQPLVVGLEKCHIEAVSQAGPRSVFFAYDSYRVGEDAEASIHAVTSELTADPDARVLLVGRASRIGDKLYNRELSRRRTLAVQDALIGSGVDQARIQAMWIGWEPPQITARIAGFYGLGDVYAREGETAVNQSVTIVIF